MQEGVPNGIGVEATSRVGDQYRVAGLSEEIQVGRINGMDGFDVAGVVLEARSVKGQLGKEAT